jgi:hypothetical protein
MATSAFGKAFAAARKAGDKEFTFGGKKFTTELKDEKTVYPQVEQKSTGTVTPDSVRKLASSSGVKLYANDFERNKGMTDDTVNPDVKKSVRRTSDENTEATNETFKKGGSVKGWGMARGARKAKMY